MSEPLDTLYDEALFLGGQPGARTLLAALFPNAEFERSYTESNKDILIGTPLYNLTLAKNYHKRVSGQKENDIHHDFTDLIISIARAHKEIDEPTGNNEKILGLAEKLTGVIRDLLRDDKATIWNKLTLALRNKPFDLSKFVTALGLTKTNNTPFKEIDLESKSDEPEPEPETEEGDEDDSEHESEDGGGVPRRRGGGGMYGGANEFLSQLMNKVTPDGKFVYELFGFADDNDISRAFVVKVIKNMVTNNAESYNISTFAQALATNLVNAYKLKLVRNSSSYESTLREKLFNAYKKGNRQVASFITTFFDVVDTLEVERIGMTGSKTVKPSESKLDAYQKGLDERIKQAIQRAETLKKEIKSANDKIKEIEEADIFEKDTSGNLKLDANGKPKLHDDDDEDNTKLVEYIKLKNSHSMATKAMEAARANLQALQKRVSQSGGAQEWNLRKVPGTDKTVFEMALPLLTSRHGDVWYTKSVGTGSQPVKITGSGSDILRRIYRAILRENIDRTAVTSLIPNAAVKLATNVKLDINYSVYFQNVVKDQTSTVPQTSVDLDDIWLNMSSGDIIKRRGDTFFRIENGVEHALREIDEQNCYGTALKWDKDKCSKFYAECLLNDDRGGLQYCIDHFAGQNMHGIALQELNQLNPHVALKLLKKFKFQKTKSLADSSIYEPQDYDSWAATVLPNQPQLIKETILSESSDGLREYLKGVVAFVKRNPAILNPGKSIKPADQTKLEMHRNSLGLKYAYKQVLDSREAREQGNQLLTLQLAQGFIPPPPLLPYPNALAGFGMTVGNGILSGGGALLDNRHNKFETNGSGISVLMDDIRSTAERNGISLTPDDTARINKAVETLNKLESNLQKTHRVIRLFSELQEIINAGTEPDETRQVSLADMKRATERTDLLKLISRNRTDMELSLANNVKTQSSLTNDLMKIYADMTDVIYGNPNPNVTDVTARYTPL